MQYGNEIPDFLPRYLIERYDFLNKKTSLNIIHNPSTKEKLKQAMIRLKYEELFVYMMKINFLKMKHKSEDNGIKKEYDEDKLNKLIKSLPYNLTEDQNKVLNEILKDIKSKRRMNRLLQGDVGSGKTVISILALYANYLSGYQGALMVPTEILALQHFNTVKSLLKDTDIKVELLVGSLTKKEKTSIHERLLNNEIDSNWYSCFNTRRCFI